MKRQPEENNTGYKYGDREDNPGVDIQPVQPAGGGLMEREAAQGYYDRASAVGGNYNIKSFNAPRREVSDNELAGNRMDMMLDENGKLMKRAAQQGRDWAGSRGLMNSSIAAGNAMGSMMDKATPLVLDETNSFRTAAGQNMDAILNTNQTNMQGNIAEAGLNADRDRDMRTHLLGAEDDRRRAEYNIENREDTQLYGTEERRDTQAWQTGERESGQEYQTGERVAGQEYGTSEREQSQHFSDSQRVANEKFQNGERLSTQEFQELERVAMQVFQTVEREAGQSYTTSERISQEEFNMKLADLDAALKREGIAAQDRNTYMQAWAMVQTGRAQAIGQAMNAIYQNTKMKADQQDAAVGKATSNFNKMYDDLFADFPEMPDFGWGGDGG